MVSEGAIPGKPQQVSRPGYKVTDVGEIPFDWGTVAVRELLIEAENGFASGSRDDNGIIQLRMNNLGTHGYIVADATLKVPVPRDVDRYVPEVGDILINNTNSVELIGKTVLYRGEFPRCVYSNHITRLRVNRDKTTPEWLLYHFMQQWGKGTFARLCARHVGQAGLSKGDILNIKLPYAPLPEQRKIASILSTVDHNIQKTQQIIEKTEELKKGLMQQLLTRGIGHTRFKQTEIGEIPEEWEVSTIGEVITLCQYGISDEMYDSGDYPILRMNNFEGGYIVGRPLKYINLSQEDLETYRLGQGDILFNRTNSIELVGKVGLFRLDGDYVFASYMLRLKASKQSVKPEFLNYYMNSEAGQARIKRFATPGVSQANINPTSLKGVLLPLPSLPEQKEIAGILSAVEAKSQLERDRKAGLEQLKKGLMQVLLTGKARVKVDSRSEARL